MESKNDKTYNHIRNSFEKRPSKAPDGIWENIDKQLYVDRVWLKLKPELDRIETAKIKSRQIVNYAAFILLFFLAASIYYILNNVKGKIQYAGKLKSDSCIIMYNQSKDNPVTIFHPRIIASASNGLSEESKVQKILTNLNNDKQNNERISSVAGNKTIIETKVTDTIAALCNNKSEYHIDSLQKLTPVQSGLFNNPSENLTMQLRYPEFVNDSIRFKPLTVPSRHQLGIIYALNNTMLIDNEFMDSHREGSMISIIPSLASSYGLSYNFNFSGSNSISSDLYIISNQNQYMNLYSNGRYYRKNIEIVYSKIVLSYQRDIRLKNMNPGSRYFVRLGTYYSVLSQNKIYYTRDNEKIDLPETSLSNNDYGIKFSLGWETDIKRIVIGGGLQSEYGIMNIFEGDNSVPSDFNRTNNFSYGLFIAIKLKY